MTEITKDVILDLLPLYIAGEVSQDTADLIKKHLDSDPQLAELARQMEQANINNEAPAPRTKEAEMENFEKTKLKVVFMFSLVSLFVMSVLIFSAIYMYWHH